MAVSMPAYTTFREISCIFKSAPPMIWLVKKQFQGNLGEVKYWHVNQYITH